MDYSAANHALWNVIIQFGYIAAVILIAISLRQTIKPIRKTMLPVAVLGGFILLIAKETGLINLDENLLSALTYHGIALGFIAMSLRTPVQREAAHSPTHKGLRLSQHIHDTGRHGPYNYDRPRAYCNA